jgi:hypothetical protein
MIICSIILNHTPLCPRWGDNAEKGISKPMYFIAGDGGSFFMTASLDFIKSCGDIFELI